ncbi:MAG TPA: ParB/RepB/Spo0J family partition protein [Candidatus Aphodovivens avicola]|nr:ParB/RepB/Spo0J family partition protein [Candidatus Aphodovivens avicola]
MAANKTSQPSPKLPVVNKQPEVIIEKPSPSEAVTAPTPSEKKEPEPEIAEKPTDEVAVADIEPNPDQPRTNFKQEEIEELAASIKKDGLLQPIVVRPMANGKYQIIAGERRWQACRYLKMEKMPVRIKDADEDKALELALIENIQRSDLNPIEEAYGYRRLMERMNLTQSEVAQVVSKGRSTIANALRLLELPEEAQQLLFEEKITAGHARAILSIPTAEGRQKLTAKLVEEKLSVRETEAIARLMSGKKDPSSRTSHTPSPASFKKVAKTLRDVLHTNVKVKTVQGKNKIEIEFKDEEDLQRLFNEITSSAE